MMPVDINWKFELEEYIKQGEPEKAEKSEAWQTAIGLQAVDGLRTSEYLLETAKAHICSTSWRKNISVFTSGMAGNTQKVI